MGVGVMGLRWVLEAGGSLGVVSDVGVVAVGHRRLYGLVLVVVLVVVVGWSLFGFS